MAFLGWFKKQNKGEDISVSERKQRTLQDAAVAATFAEAGEHDTARHIVDTKKKGYQTILVIGQEEGFSERLASYAIDMAKRLDFDIMAVNITDEPLSMSEEKRKEATAAFEEKCIANSAFFNQKAANADIPLHHLMLIGKHDEMIEKIHNLYPGMRYVLTEPDPEVVNKAKDNVSIPVFDLGSYQGSAA